MKMRIKILLISMLIITAVYLGAVVYANSNSLSGSAIDAAFLYHGEPKVWYTPEQLGIVKILGYQENATWIQVVYGDQGPLINPEVEEPPIFKYRGKFWQISKLHVTPSLPESVKRWQVPIGGMIAVGWVFIGALYFKSKRKNILMASIFMVSLATTSLNFPTFAEPRLQQPSSDLHVFPALPEEVCNAEPLPLPENSTIEFLNTTNPYSKTVSPLDEIDDIEGDKPLYVLVFVDEEEREYRECRGEDWKEYAEKQIERGDNALASIFGIDIRILGVKEWDSDDSKDSMYDLWDELAAETKSYLGQWYEGEFWQNYVDAIIGITDQLTLGDWPKMIAGLASGPLSIDKGNIFVLVNWLVYWADDNLLQHEVSHLFYADDEYPYCGAMAYHTHFQTFIWEDGLWTVFAEVDCAYTSYDWDSYNKAIISKYSSSYTDEEHNGMLILRQGPLVFPFNERGTASWDYGVYSDIGGAEYEISVESVKPGCKFYYWLIDGVTKVYSETVKVYVPANGKVRVALYFTGWSPPYYPGYSFGAGPGRHARRR